MKNSEFTVIALGGSLVVPHLSDAGGVNVPFLRKFRSFLLRELKNGRKFILVVGGGKTARMYVGRAAKVAKSSNEDLDWLGIHATRLNAHLLRTIFAKEAYPIVIDHDPAPEEAAVLKQKRERLYLAGGWRPGHSTDHVAVMLAVKFSASDVIIAGDTAFVYDKDPKKFKGARPIPELSWKEYQKLIPKKWTPGLSSPVDPSASRLAQEMGIRAKIVDGSVLKNLQRAVEGKPFEGTVIQ
ncbi:MAG: UMP kinase [Candidatus Yanofskybacteria bacterium]|nr:UMP kinase [Candidatus Yanofskybacteria bacterium]